MLTDRLNEADRAALTAHLLALSPEDRCVRFGYAPRDASVKRYVQDIDFSQDAVFGVRGDDRTLDGVMHLGLEKGLAEIAVSVLTPARRCGIGSALVSRAATYASRHGIDTLYMQGLRENCAMIRIAQSLGIKVVTDGVDAVEIKAKKRVTLYDAVMRDALGGQIPNRVLQRTWQQINLARAAV